MTFDELVAAYQEAAARADRGRRRHAPHRDDLRHAQRARPRSSASRRLFEAAGVELPVIDLAARSPTRPGGRCRGQTVEAFWNSVAPRPAAERGAQLRAGRGGAPAVRRRSWPGSPPLPVIALPERRPAQRVRRLRRDARSRWPTCSARFARDGLVNIVGGCCGTTPAHIRAIAEAVRGPAAAPAAGDRADDPADRASSRSRSGPADVFVNVGERTNVTGSRKFAKLILEGDYEEAVEVARQQVESGAQMIDVNMDEAMLDSEAAMRASCGCSPPSRTSAAVPVMIDSSKWSVIEAGLQVRPGQGRRELDHPQGGRGGVPPRRPRSSAATAPPSIVMAFDEQGQADTVERKVDDLPTGRYRPAHRAGRLPAGGHHLRPEHLRHRAPGSRSTPNYAVAYIEATRRIKAELPAHASRERRCQQRLVRLPRQRPGPRGDPRRVPLPRHRGRDGHGHRQRRPARDLRRHRPGAAGARRGRGAEPPARRHRAAARGRRQRRRAGAGGQRRTRWPGASGRSRSG